MINALIIDDDLKLQELLTQFMTNYGIKVESNYDGKNVLNDLDKFKSEIIILDIMLPGKDGFEVLKEIRTISLIPVIMLTARGDDADKIMGLEIGADDYMSKPFNPRELVARIKAVLRRNDSNEKPVVTNKTIEPIKKNGLILYPKTLEIKALEKIEELSLTEFKILKALMENPNEALSRDNLLDVARGKEFEAFDRTIDMHISRIRAKIKSVGISKKLIKTCWGRGYMFVGDE